MPVFMGHVIATPNKGDQSLSEVLRGERARYVWWEIGDNKQNELSEAFLSFSSVVLMVSSSSREGDSQEGCSLIGYSELEDV